MSKGKSFQDENAAPLTGAEALFGIVRAPGGTRPAPRAPRPFVAAKPDHYPGYSAENLAQITGQHITSARRWKRKGAPPVIAKLLRILAGDLGEIDPAWRDWTLRNGKIHGPGDWSFNPGDVLAIPFRVAQVHHLQNQKRYEVQADFIDQKWNSPDERKAPDPETPPAPPVDPPNRRKAAVLRRLRNAT